MENKAFSGELFYANIKNVFGKICEYFFLKLSSFKLISPYCGTRSEIFLEILLSFVDTIDCTVQ